MCIAAPAKIYTWNNSTTSTLLGVTFLVLAQCKVMTLLCNVQKGPDVVKGPFG